MATELIQENFPEFLKFFTHFSILAAKSKSTLQFIVVPEVFLCFLVKELTVVRVVTFLYREEFLQIFCRELLFVVDYLSSPFHLHRKLDFLITCKEILISDLLQIESDRIINAGIYLSALMALMFYSRLREVGNINEPLSTETLIISSLEIRKALFLAFLVREIVDILIFILIILLIGALLIFIFFALLIIYIAVIKERRNILIRALFSNIILVLVDELVIGIEFILQIFRGWNIERIVPLFRIIDAVFLQERDDLVNVTYLCLILLYCLDQVIECDDACLF